MSFSKYSSAYSNSKQLNSCKNTKKRTLIIIERSGDLIDDIIGIFEETEEARVDFDTKGVFVFLHEETSQEEILHPMILDLKQNSFLSTKLIYSSLKINHT